jgi:hypothetical protein
MTALAPSHRKETILWITSAKRVETAERRPELAAERLRAGIKTPMRANDAPDLSRDRGWDAVRGAGWQAVSLVAIDPTWSALRFENDRR